MRPARTLVLRREALAELGLGELGRVAGGNTPGCHITLYPCQSVHECLTVPVGVCLSRDVCR